MPAGDVVKDLGMQFLQCETHGSNFSLNRSYISFVVLMKNTKPVSGDDYSWGLVCTMYILAGIIAAKFWLVNDKEISFYCY